MPELRWIKMFLFMLLLRFAVSEQLYVAVRAGDDVTLTCNRVKDDQENCQNTEWIYNDAAHTRTDSLVRRGQVVSSRSHRLRVGHRCSLVLQKVTYQDAGIYFCRQDGDSSVYLSVVNMTENKVEDQIGFYCSVFAHKDCKPSVKWLHQGEVVTDHKDVNKPDTFFYYAVVSYEASQLNSSVVNSLKCEMTDCRSNVHHFPLRPQASDEDMKSATTEPTTSATTVRNSFSTSVAEAPAKPEELRWWLITGAVGLAAVVVVVITVKRCRRGSGRKQGTKEKSDAGDGLSYASISFTKRSGTAQVQTSDGGDAVTYSCVNVGSPAAASVDPSSLYATVCKPQQ